MTTETSPRPWRVIRALEDEPARVIDSNDEDVAIELTDADAALIVDAVNYYKPDLHCDWRELTPEEAVAHCREVAARLGDTPCARDHLQLAAWIEERDRLRDIVRRLVNQFGNLTSYDDDAAILREARAAIGEGSR